MCSHSRNESFIFQNFIFSFPCSSTNNFTSNHFTLLAESLRSLPSQCFNEFCTIFLCLSKITTSSIRNQKALYVTDKTNSDRLVCLKVFVIQQSHGIAGFAVHEKCRKEKVTEIVVLLRHLTFMSEYSNKSMKLRCIFQADPCLQLVGFILSSFDVQVFLSVLLSGRCRPQLEFDSVSFLYRFNRIRHECSKSPIIN